jgi:hypothetical protein
MTRKKEGWMGRKHNFAGRKSFSQCIFPERKPYLLQALNLNLEILRWNLRKVKRRNRIGRGKERGSMSAKVDFIFKPDEAERSWTYSSNAINTTDARITKDGRQ